MKIKLEITSKPLTNEQREAIEEKLKEIKAIVNNEGQWLTKQSFPSHSLQSENKTLPQSALCDVWSNGKRFQVKREHLLNVQSPSPQKQMGEKISIYQQIEAESFLLEIALEHMFRSKRHYSQQYGMSQASELGRFLLQVDNFQKSVKRHLLPLLGNIHHNKI